MYLCMCVCLSADEIREYYGESIAMYFAFLGYYTFFLIPLALLGFIANFYFSDSYREFSIAVFCVFNLFWATIFLESWKRKTAELAYQWGTIDTEHFEEPRAAFYGEIGKDPVTGRNQPQYPSFRRQMKVYLVSVPVMAIAVVVAWFVMLLYFHLEDSISSTYEAGGLGGSVYEKFISLLPTTVYAVIVMILNAIYQRIAVFLTDWGNNNLIPY